MIRHLLKLVWHRKRANALIMVEIFFSFLVTFAVLTIAGSIGWRWADPLGFSWHDVWVIRMDIPDSGDMTDKPETRQAMRELLREVKTFPEVAEAAEGQTPPYALSTWEGVWRVNGRRIVMTRDEVTDDYAKTMNLKVVRGRWFRPEDEALGYDPVVIDVDLARAMYDDRDPVGEKFDKDGDRVSRIVGVVARYRKDGELSRLNLNMAFNRASLTTGNGRAPRNIVLRLRPGTPASFEGRLAKRLHAVAPSQGFRIRHMNAMRDNMLRIRMAPVIILAVVGFFLISMVALGLTGVLWQNVTRRTREIGLRRAFGASGPNVRGQVLIEVALIATFALICGLVIVLQLPILGVFAFVTPQLYTFGIISALVVIYAIALLCAAYPSRLASTVQPAEALRYE